MSTMERLRQRVSEVGRPGAILEEMIRLGFIDENDLKSTRVSKSDVKKVLTELEPILKEIAALESEEFSLGDIGHLLLEIRRERIEMVKVKRETRKAQKLRDKELKHQEWERSKRQDLPFLGVGVSSRLDFQGGNDSEIERRSLPLLHSPADLANAMGISTEDLVWLCYERGVTQTDHYSRFEIPKRSGGNRLISSPKPKMRQAQVWINDQVLSKLNPSRYAFAFRPGVSIVDNARIHADKRVVVKMDLEDFFPSLTFPRVRGYFEFIGYNPGIATLLALLCTDAPRVRVTFKGQSEVVAVGPRSLPQGACTSPALANLIASRLDVRLARFAESCTDFWVYTRYADDLTFSTKSESPEIGRFMAAIRNIVADEKLKVNSKKTRIMRHPKRQSVTGLIVGPDVRIPKATIKKMRSLFHNISTNGHELVSTALGKDALSVARGYWSYLYMVQPDLARKYLSKYPWLNT